MRASIFAARWADLGEIKNARGGGDASKLAALAVGRAAVRDGAPRFRFCLRGKR